jgi:mono/diheme cytochrome c family protein
MVRIVLPTRLALVAALTALPAAHGGWAVVTLHELPDEIVVNHPTTLTFTVRQHGRTLLTALHGRVTAEGGGTRVEAAAQPGESAGEYQATLSLPRPGAWTITISSGFGSSNVTLLPIPAVGAGRTAAALAPVDVGQRLFVAKGCATCHRHAAVAGSGVVRVGPDLTALRVEPGFLARFLADPSILPPDAQGQQMPNLGLAPREIAALVAFVNAEPAVTAGQ